MDRNTGDLGWSDEQWSRANKTVQQEAQKARVAGQFLPTYVQGDTTATAVPRHALDYDATPQPPPAQRLWGDSDPTLFLTSLAVNISLSSQEAGDPDQAAALIELRRAANLIARLEDALIFRGRQANEAPIGTGALPPVFTVSGGGALDGLLASATGVYPPRRELNPGANGEELAGRIIEAVGLLEEFGHNRPF